MNQLFSTVAIMVFAFLAEQFLPWWSIAIAAALVGLLAKGSALNAFFSGFLGIGLLWLGMATWINAQNQGLLANKMALLFGLPEGAISLLFLTALVGALVGGFSATTGKLLAELLAGKLSMT